MLHFLAFLEFLTAIVGTPRQVWFVLMSLCTWVDAWSCFQWIRLAHRHNPHPCRCNSLPSQRVSSQGAWSVFAIIFTHIVFGGFTRPILFVALIHTITFGFDLAVFIVALTYPPYTEGCANSSTKGCHILRAAIGLDGALWYDPTVLRGNGRIFFLLSAFVLCYDSRAWDARGYGGAGVRRPRYYY
jgi:hypothetical protein